MVSPIIPAIFLSNATSAPQKSALDAEIFPVGAVATSLKHELTPLANNHSHGENLNPHRENVDSHESDLGGGAVDTLTLYIEVGEGHQRAHELRTQGYPDFDIIELDPAANQQPVQLWRRRDGSDVEVYDLDSMGNIVLTEHRIRALIAEHFSADVGEESNTDIGEESSGNVSADVSRASSARKVQTGETSQEGITALVRALQRAIGDTP